MSQDYVGSGILLSLSKYKIFSGSLVRQSSRRWFFFSMTDSETFIRLSNTIIFEVDASKSIMIWSKCFFVPPSSFDVGVIDVLVSEIHLVSVVCFWFQNRRKCSFDVRSCGYSRITDSYVHIQLTLQSMSSNSVSFPLSSKSCCRLKSFGSSPVTLVCLQYRYFSNPWLVIGLRRLS